MEHSTFSDWVCVCVYNIYGIHTWRGGTEMKTEKAR